MNIKQERQLILLLAAINFTHIMDFMVIMPLGPQLMELFNISAVQFGVLVSSYTAAAAISSLSVAFVLDRFDRRTMLIWGYGLFLIATLACALATSFEMLLIARIAAGTFGGLLGVIVQTIIGDVVPFERRGDAMGKLMAAFSVATVAGVPTGLIAATYFGWHAPFWMLVIIGALVFAYAWINVPRLNTHISTDKQAVFATFARILSKPVYGLAYCFTAAMMFTGFVVIPFITIYVQGNLQVPAEQVPWIYFVGGVATLISSPIIGKVADKIGKSRTYITLALLSTIPLVVLTHLPMLPLWMVLVVTSVFFVMVSGRMIPAMAVITQVPSSAERGAFMSLNNSVQSAAMALGSVVGGWLANGGDGNLVSFGLNGWVAAVSSVVSIMLFMLLMEKIKVQSAASTSLK